MYKFLYACFFKPTRIALSAEPVCNELEQTLGEFVSPELLPFFFWDKFAKM